MPAPRPVLYIDLGSPYAYLAAERAATVLGVAPEFQPVLLGAIFRWRGWGSWSATDERDGRVADIEARAAEAGLPPLRWPPGWPADGLAAARAATWAAGEGAAEPFARAVFRRQFGEGADIAEPAVLASCAQEAGLDPDELPAAIARPAVKEALKGATQAAWDAGVRGIPSVRIGSEVFFGDDQLPAAALARSSAS